MYTTPRIALAMFTMAFVGVVRGLWGSISIKGHNAPREYRTSFFFCIFDGGDAKGPPFHGSRSSREINIQHASCQMGGREFTR